MIFCGQCGIQLAPGAVRCPRCGAAVEEAQAAASGEELHTDDQTIAAQALNIQGTSAGNRSYAPQQLVLRPGEGNPAAYDATSRVDPRTYQPQSYNTMGTGMGSSYASIPSQTQATGYPGYQTQATTNQFIPPGQHTYTNANVTGYVPQAGRETSGNNSRLRVISMIIVLVGLLFILSAVILFALQNSGALSKTNDATNITITMTTTSEPATQQAQRVIERYYKSINAQNYQAAYDLWQHSPQTYADFSDGFKHTKHDDLTIDKTTEQADGTVKLMVTVMATDDNNGKQEQNTYKGYYIVGKQSDNIWKIVDAELNKQ